MPTGSVQSAQLIPPSTSALLASTGIVILHSAVYTHCVAILSVKACQEVYDCMTAEHYLIHKTLCVMDPTERLSEFILCTKD